MNKPHHVLYLVTEDWYFRSHRFDLARRVRDGGHRVSVGTRTDTCGEFLRGAGLDVRHVPFVRSLRAPLRDLQSLCAIRRLARELQPDIVHLVSLKPILLGGLALGGRSRPALLCAFTGLGYVFSSSAPLAMALRPLVIGALRWICRSAHVWIVVQNDDDRRLIASLDVGEAARVRLIPGSGVDLVRFAPTPLPAAPLVLLPARLLVDKGIGEFVEAARRVVVRRPGVRFVVVGSYDPDNPGALGRGAVETLGAETAVEWWGHRSDMADVYREATIVCLPSYREGLPKALLEAAACGRPLVATDVPGCREICIDGESGRLVPVRDAATLADVLVELLDDPDACRRFGAGARRTVEARFGIERITRETLALYDEMCPGTPR